MSFSLTPPTGGKTPGTGMSRSHNHASQMAFAAGNRARVARLLGAKTMADRSLAATPPTTPVQPVQPVNYRTGFDGASDAVHAAIDGLVDSGHFTPHQGVALKAHQGPLVGDAGRSTTNKIRTQMAIMAANTNKAKGLS